VFFTTWDDLIERAKQSHSKYREVLQRRATGSTEADGVDMPEAVERPPAKRRVAKRKAKARKKK